MICPDSNFDCDNPGCRRGGCQGRRPSLPLFRACAAAASLPPLDAAMAGETMTVPLTAAEHSGERLRRPLLAV